MASTYTLNNGIELIGTGEQSGTWGDTTNTNLSLLDTALDGQVTVTLATAGTSGSPNALPISDGSASDGRNRMIIFADGGDLGATAYVQLTPNDAEKIIYIRNDLSGSRSILFFQGTYNASNDYEVPAGTTAVIYFDGGGTGAVAANVFNNAYFDSLRLGSLSVTAILDEDDMSSDSATALATQQSIKKYVDDKTAAQNELSEVLANGNTSGGNAIQMTTTDELQFRDTALKISSSADGQLDIDADTEIEIVAPTVDIDASTAMTIDTAALTVTGAVDLNTSLNVDGTVTSDGLTVAGNVSVDGGTIKLDGNYPTGTGNVALGDQAGDALITGGNYNVAIGNSALSGITTGDQNIAIGSSALQIVTANANTAIGYNSAPVLTTGSVNTGLGGNTFSSLVSGSNNVAIGRDAGLTLGDEIVATDIVSGINYTIQTSGTTDFTLIGAADSNPGTTFTATGAGTGTGTASANASYNTFVGHASSYLMVGGSKNTVLGRFNGNQNTIDIRNSDNNIVLSDGDGNPRLAYVSANTELVINEQSADVDFRVESNDNANMLFVDASANLVNIGDSSSAWTAPSLVVSAPMLDLSTSTARTTNAGIVLRPSTTVDTNGWYGMLFANSTVDGFGYTIGGRRTEASGNNGALDFRFHNNSSSGSSRLYFTNGATIFNDDSANQDFRVESDNKAHMLFVDAGSDQVLVGESSANANTAYMRVGEGVVNLNGTNKFTMTIADGSTDGLNGGLHINNYQPRLVMSDASTNGDWIDMRMNGTSFILGMGDNTDLFTRTVNQIMVVTPNELSINNGGNDYDFRVESDSETHMLFVDAANNRVGIGTNGPESTLSVDGDILSNWGNSGQQKIGIAARGANIFSTTGRTLILTGADAVAGAQAMAGGDVIVRGGKGRANTGLNTYAGHLYLEGGEHTTSGETSGAGNVYIKTAGNVRASFYAGGDVAIPTNDASEFFKIDHSANDLMLGSTGSNDGGTLTLGESGQATYSSNANEGMLGLVRFNNTGNSNQHSGILFRVTSNNASNNSTASIGVKQPSSSSHNSQFYFNLRSQSQNAIRQYALIDSENGFIMNDGGESYMDFRVESNGNASMLFVDGGNDKVIMGDSTSHSNRGLSIKADQRDTSTTAAQAGAFLNLQPSSTTDTTGATGIFLGSSTVANYGWSIQGRRVIASGGGSELHFNYHDNSSGGTQEMRLTYAGVVIAGSLSKGSGSFRIDHPLPEKSATHNLVHSFVEAPQADNIYRGKIDLVAGQASVNIDTVAGMTEGTFAALNREVQCFTSNETGWTAVRGSVSGNILTIEAQDNTCTDTISWLVIGERQDQHMYDTDWTDDNGKVIVEPLKDNPQP